MAILNGLAGACEAMLEYMSDFQGSNYAFNLKKKTGTLDFITSGFNLESAGARQLELQDQRGKGRKARVVYSQRSKSSDAQIGTGEKPTVCDTGKGKEEKEIFVDITRWVATNPIYFTNTQLQEICRDAGTFMQMHLFDELRAARELLNENILALLLAAQGPIIGHDGTTTPAGTPKSLKLISIESNGNRIPLDGPFEQIPLDYENMELTGKPAIIGQGILDEYFRLKSISCCNATIPYDPTSINNVAYFKDQTANAVLGANEFLVVAPGSTMLLTHNENIGIAINDDSVRHFTMPDPVIPGLMWDIDFEWDKCEKKYKWFASFWWDLFNTFQPDSFQSGDYLDGITGINNYKATAS